MNELENINVEVLVEPEPLKASDIPALRTKLEQDVAALLIEFCNKTGLDVLSLSLDRFRQIGFERGGTINRLQITVGLE